MNEINFFDSLEGNDTLPLYCVCCLDYGSLPTILLHSLPVKVQRLILNRLAHTNLPQFILTTHKGGHWSLVQLHYISNNINNNNNNNSQTIPSNSTPSLDKSHMADCLDSLNQLKDVASEVRSPVCTNYVSSIEFNLDPHTTAYFSDSYVKFMLTTKTSDKNWHCPFCKASYSLISSDRVNILERHLRLHTEIRCCVDCVTILPNNTYSLNCESACIHDCNELVSSQIKDDYQQYQHADNSSTDLPHKIINLPTPDDCNDQPENSDVFPTFHRDNSQIQLRNCDVPLNSVAKTSCTYFSAGNWRRICTKCKVGFKTPAHYQQHLKNVHRGKKFLCQDCGVLFSTKGNLTTHFNQIHNQNASLPCPICDKYLSNRFNLDRHIRSLHSDYEISSNSSLKVNSAPVSNNSEGAHLTNSMTVANPNEPPRGYYLYLSDSDCQQSVNTNSPTSYTNSSGNTQSVLQLISPIVDSKSVSLVADISLIPCGPSNPDAQLGVGGKLWKQNINIVQSPKSNISKSFHPC